MRPGAVEGIFYLSVLQSNEFQTHVPTWEGGFLMWGNLLGRHSCPHLEQQQATARAHLQKERAKKKGALIEMPTRPKAGETRLA